VVIILSALSIQVKMLIIRSIVAVIFLILISVLNAGFVERIVIINFL